MENYPLSTGASRIISIPIIVGFVRIRQAQIAFGRLPNPPRAYAINIAVIRFFHRAITSGSAKKGLTADDP